MQLVIVILIVAVAAGYLIRRIIKHGPGSSCGCNCSQDKNNCTEQCSSKKKKTL